MSSSSVGDVSHPAKRGSPIAALEDACGGPGELLPDAPTRIVRTPYLQQLTTTSVIIGWLSKDGSSERVDITKPDGTGIGEATAEIDRTARQSGDKQMWATVKDLEPDTIYCYKVVAGDKDLSQRIGFRTAPDANTTRKISFLAFGDSGGAGGDQFALLDQMNTVPYDLIIHTGDIAYDQGTIAQFEDTVFAVYGELFRHIAFFPSAGNHEYDTMQGAPFREVFNLPGTEKWYSFDYGPIHFAALDTEADYGTQAKWLDADLAASKAPWKIVYLHKPPYSTGEHGSDLALRKLIAPIAEKRGVELVLAGHDHDYERMTPQNGVEYVVTGGGGKGTRPVGKSDFTAFSVDVIHFVYVEVEDDKLTLHAIDGTGNEFDSVVVDRKQ